MSSDDFSRAESSIKPTVDAANSAIESAAKTDLVSDLESRIASLQKQEKELKQRIEDLQASYNRALKNQTQTVQTDLGRLIKQGLLDLERRKQVLQTDVEQLERRQERIRAEMRTSFAGVSQDLAIRVQGFKDYLVGSLQDLASAAEQLDLSPPAVDRPLTAAAEAISAPADSAAAPPTPEFAAQRFQAQTERIRSLLDQYRLRPDYYGPVWQLRRTFEPVHAEKISNWFFTQGGRGAVKSMGSRLQNVLIASTGISVLRTLYGDRLRTLILANTPERLGEWRRGLQDCLGVSRPDFGADRGLVLFEAPEPLAQRADRLLDREQLPFIIIDESEDQINLSLLQFPLWLAFAPDPMNPPADYDYY